MYVWIFFGFFGFFLVPHIFFTHTGLYVCISFRLRKMHIDLLLCVYVQNMGFQNVCVKNMHWSTAAWGRLATQILESVGCCAAHCNTLQHTATPRTYQQTRVCRLVCSSISMQRYVCACVCVCVLCVCVRVCVCMHACVCMCACICVCACACGLICSLCRFMSSCSSMQRCVRECDRVRACVRVCACIDVCACVRACVRARAR